MQHDKLILLGAHLTLSFIYKLISSLSNPDSVIPVFQSLVIEEHSRQRSPPGPTASFSTKAERCVGRILFRRVRQG
jgi:hypothetical protein